MSKANVALAKTTHQEKCPVCGMTVYLTDDGKLWQHGQGPTKANDTMWWCVGSDTFAWIPLNPGDQIAYVPTPTNGDPEHPQAELGFVTSTRNNLAFCRMWSKKPGKENTLRTTANSTPIYRRDLVLHDSHPQEMVNRMLKAL